VSGSGRGRSRRRGSRDDVDEVGSEAGISHRSGLDLAEKSGEFEMVSPLFVSIERRREGRSGLCKRRG
jgi:hypothetical protein